MYELIVGVHAFSVSISPFRFGYLRFRLFCVVSTSIEILDASSVFSSPHLTISVTQIALFSVNNVCLIFVSYKRSMRLISYFIHSFIDSVVCSFSKTFIIAKEYDVERRRSRSEEQNRKNNTNRTD